MLRSLAEGDECFVVAAVLDEVKSGVRAHPEVSAIEEASWLEPVRIEGLDDLAVFAEYVRVLGSGPRNVGEAETLTWAEKRGAIAVIDERAAVRCGRERDVEVHGTLWLIAEGYRASLLARNEVISLIDALADAEAWFPAEARGEDFFEWASQEGMIDGGSQKT